MSLLVENIMSFSLPYSKIKFCNDYSDSTTVALVTDVTDTGDINWFTINDLNNMKKSINSITYSNGGN